MSRSLRSALAAVAVTAAAAGLTSLQPSASTSLKDVAQRVPTPESVIGWAPCADNKLATYEQISDYFTKLDAASNRMKLFDIGKTAEGRTQQLSVISAPENLRGDNLEWYREIAGRLSRAKGLTDDQAKRLSREGKAVVWLDYGIHATENASQQAAPWIAHRLVTEETPEMRAIRDKVITIVVPSLNPDGNTYVANWFRNNFGKPWESRLPELYQKYAGHDNNRDWYMLNLDESRNVARQLYTQWYPQVVHNNHQSAPFPARIFIPPFEDPPNPNIQPMTLRGVNLVGDAMSRRLDQEGKPGAVSRIQFDTWWNGGMRSAPYYHNMIGILTETAHTSPRPTTYDPKDFPETFANGESTSQPSTFYPSPYKGGEWHLRDSCDYMITASMGLLDLAAEKRQELLYDSYQQGRDAIRAGEDETYVVPADQTDFPTAVKMVNVLRRGGVDVEQARSPFRVGDKTYPADSFLVRGGQAFRPHLTDLLNPQVYPDRRLYPGGPPEPPYDITGYTLSMQMGVQVDKLATHVQASTRRVDMAKPPAGEVAGEGATYALDPRVNDSFIAVNRLLKAGDKVARATEAVTTSEGSWPAGAFLVTAGSGTRDRLDGMAEELGLTVATVGSAPSSAKALKAPRIAVYQAWGSGFYDEGWTRYILEGFEFPFTRLHDSDIRAGGLREKFDVVVLPDASFNQMRNGLAAGSMPEQYTGGMGDAGIANLKTFAEAGGVVVGMDSASELPRRGFGLPATDVTEGQPEDKFFIPGSILKVKIDNTQPVGYGMPADGAAFFPDSPAYSVTEGSNLKTVASYPASGLLMSGWLLGEEVIANRSAVIDAPVGQGRAVMLGFRTQHRAQAHGTYKLLFNSLYLGEPSS